MTKNDRVRVHHEKNGWGESSLMRKRAMGGDFTMREGAMG